MILVIHPILDDPFLDDISIIKFWTIVVIHFWMMDDVNIHPILNDSSHPFLEVVSIYHPYSPR